MTLHRLDEPAPPRGPLDGVGVIVTRPARQAGAFAQKLGVLGARPIMFPAIVILPPRDEGALADTHRVLATYAAAIFVSANAVEYGVPHSPWPANVMALTPGPGSASALTDLGVPNVAFPSAQHDSEGLLAMPALQNVAGKRVAIFRGDGGRDLLGDTLRARGARVDYVSCYRRVPPSAGGDGLAALLRAGDADALTLTSSEGAANLVAALDAGARAVLARLPAFATHPRIAARAGELGLRAMTTASGDAGLIAALLQWFAAHPREPSRR
ncbi:MAG TPA: uroporphyrinogen-III synthase [Casimicrobiaceae bacterium]|jgi:uroporphyrinogen-III synthase